MLKADIVGVVEVAYQVALPDEATWLQGILDAVRPCLDNGAGVYVSTYAISDDRGIEVAHILMHGLPDWFPEAMRQFASAMPPADVERILFRQPVGLMSKMLGAAPKLYAQRALRKKSR